MMINFNPFVKINPLGTNTQPPGFTLQQNPASLNAQTVPMDSLVKLYTSLFSLVNSGGMPDFSKLNMANSKEAGIPIDPETPKGKTKLGDGDLGDGDPGDDITLSEVKGAKPDFSKVIMIDNPKEAGIPIDPKTPKGKTEG